MKQDIILQLTKDHNYNSYPNDIPKKIMDYALTKISYYKNEYNYQIYEFRIINKDVVIYYYDFTKDTANNIIRYEILDKYYVSNVGVYSTKIHKYYLYSAYNKFLNYIPRYFDHDVLFEDDIATEDSTFFDPDEDQDVFLYVDNLIDLKSTKLYQDSSFWLCKDFLANNNKIVLKHLTYCPVYLKQFADLVNLGYYGVAFNSEYFNHGASLQDIFVIPTKNIKYFKNKIKNLSIRTDDTTFCVKVLQDIITTFPDLSNKEITYLYSNKNRGICQIAFDDTFHTEIIHDLLKYCHTNLKTRYEIFEYVIYVLNMKYLGHDINNKKILFPNHHKVKELCIKSLIANIKKENKNIDKKISLIAKKYSKYNYKDKLYTIYIPSSLKEIITEITILNGLGMFEFGYYNIYSNITKFINKDSILFFLHRNSSPTKPYLIVRIVINKISKTKKKYYYDVIIHKYHNNKQTELFLDKWQQKFK